MNTLQEVTSMKLEEQPKLLRVAGSTIFIACQTYVPFIAIMISVIHRPHEYPFTRTSFFSNQ